MATNFHITVRESNGSTKNIALDRPPQECPLCHRGQQPHNLGDSFLSSKENSDGIYTVQTIHRCSYVNCEKVFISFYAYVPGQEALYVKSLPEAFQSYDWDESIAKVSPDFVDIYSQANEAESRDLSKVAGPGYRKSLEFLIKDWLIQSKPEEREKIVRASLGNVIKEYVDHPKVKEIAARATWLGNDETHYYRKWSDKDIEDLKNLIQLTAAWINMNELSESLTKSMTREADDVDESDKSTDPQ